MGRTNLELTNAAFEPWQAGHLEEFAGFVHEDVEWDITQHPLPDFPPTGRGREAFIANMAEYASGWIDYRTELRDGVEIGDEVLMEIHEWARMRETGIELDRVVYIAWTVRDGLLTRFRVYKTREEALAAI